MSSQWLSPQIPFVLRIIRGSLRCLQTRTCTVNVTKHSVLVSVKGQEGSSRSVGNIWLGSLGEETKSETKNRVVLSYFWSARFGVFFITLKEPFTIQPTNSVHHRREAQQGGHFFHCAMQKQAQRGKGTCLRSHSTKQGLEPQLSEGDFKVLSAVWGWL